MPGRRSWQSTPGEPHRQRSLVGYSPWSRKESDTTEWLSSAQPERNYLGLPNKQPSRILPQQEEGRLPCCRATSPANGKPSSSANEKPSSLNPFLSSNELSFFLCLWLPFLGLPSFYKSCPCPATSQSICLPDEMLLDSWTVKKK